MRRQAAFALDCAILLLALAPAGWAVQRALDVSPTTGPQIWGTLMLNFSLPTWIYFLVMDASPRGTLGKRAFGLRVVANGAAAPRILLRTIVKLLPWELVHVSMFAMSTDLQRLSAAQTVGLVSANVLIVVYLVATIATTGQRALHDRLAGTAVVRVR